MEIERQLKTALDESRLLILGAQVLFGFQFQATFQELFSSLPASSRYIHCAGLLLLLISVGLLIAPSLFHQIIFEGESRSGAINAATVLAGASLLPLTIGLGAMFRSFASMTWGSEIYSLPTPFSAQQTMFRGVSISHEYVSIIVGTVLLCAVLYAFFCRKMVGAHGCATPG